MVAENDPSSAGPFVSPHAAATAKVSTNQILRCISVLP
jgi:hypothetical protein